jgi:hypothetical protein
LLWDLGFFLNPGGILDTKGPAMALEAGVALRLIPIMCRDGDFRKSNAYLSLYYKSMGMRCQKCFRLDRAWSPTHGRQPGIGGRNFVR